MLDERTKMKVIREQVKQMLDSIVETEEDRDFLNLLKEGDTIFKIGMMLVKNIGKSVFEIERLKAATEDYSKVGLIMVDEVQKLKNENKFLKARLLVIETELGITEEQK